MKLKIFLIGLLLSSLVACKTSKSPTRTATSDRPTATKSKTKHSKKNKYSYETLPQMSSNLNVHYRLSKKSIQEAFNTTIDQYMINEVEIPNLGMQVKLSKSDEATIEFANQDVLLVVPVNLEIEKKTFFKDLKATGSLALSFITSVDVDTSWNLITKTTLSDYEWIEKPKLDIGVVQLPIESLASTIIERSKETLENQINESINEQFLLRQRILKVMQHIETPIYADTIGAWIRVDPSKVSLTGVFNTEQFAEGVIGVTSNAHISTKKPTETPGINLPDFEWDEKLQDTSHLKMYIDMAYDDLNAMVKDNFVGKTFQDGDKQITVHDIDVTKDGDKIAIVSEVSGSFNGKIVAKGRPVFDSEKQTFYAKDIDIKVKTKNVLHKAAAWMLKGKIKSKIEEMAEFSVASQLENLQTQIDQQIKLYNQDDKLNISLHIEKFAIDDFILDNQSIFALINISMDIKADVHDFINLDIMNTKIPALKN